MKEPDLEYSDLGAWVQYGFDKGWVSRPVCATHEGVPGTEAEDAEWDEGGDPCQVVMRVWQS